MSAPRSSSLAPGASHWWRSRGKVAGAGAAFMCMVISAVFASTPAAQAVSSRPPAVAKVAGFIFGQLPHRPEVTRRVVATRSPATNVHTFSVLTPVTPDIVPHALPLPTPTLAPTPPVVHTVAPIQPPPAPPATPVTVPLPPRGQATAYGCAAAIAYLTAYSAPGFVVQCPANAGGHQATTTCATTTSLCNVERLIQIADPCAAAYMNEASNSWVLIGESSAPIDPYGKCY